MKAPHFPPGISPSGQQESRFISLALGCSKKTLEQSLSGIALKKLRDFDLNAGAYRFLGGLNGILAGRAVPQQVNILFSFKQFSHVLEIIQVVKEHELVVLNSVAWHWLAVRVEDQCSNIFSRTDESDARGKFICGIENVKLINTCSGSHNLPLSLSLSSSRLFKAHQIVFF
jgi:uncharacterized MAPEG superfamily protein